MIIVRLIAYYVIYFVWNTIKSAPLNAVCKRAINGGKGASMGEEDYVIPHEVFLKIERRPDKFRYYNAIYVVVKHCVEYAEAEQYAAARREYLSLLSALKEQFL